ncbi:MAG: hypothetical protein NVV66_03450 [Cellulomonas sp.]|uniref:hypothetical protein n=1 Tax=Cellulomonas sp. TaxID=40001 RepID=UPI002583F9A7|nr:hypothetical protein [Cellulomonas sp.]MCR6703772.1 hypothetical protein [Cellulomonas sp.]
MPTPDDVDTDASTVVVRPVEASQTAGLIADPDIAGVVVNNNFATARASTSTASCTPTTRPPPAPSRTSTCRRPRRRARQPVYQRSWLSTTRPCSVGRESWRPAVS